MSADTLPTLLGLKARNRFARAAVVYDLEAVAQAFEAGARECREFAEAAPAWQAESLRRKLAAIVAATMAAVVEAETASEAWSSHAPSGTIRRGEP